MADILQILEIIFLYENYIFIQISVKYNPWGSIQTAIIGSHNGLSPNR